MHSSVGSQVHSHNSKIDLVHPDLLQFSVQYAHFFNPTGLISQKRADW